MLYHLISNNEFISPKMFRSFFSPKEGVVEGGKVKSDGWIFCFKEKVLPNGTPLKVWLGNNSFICEPLEDIKEKEKTRIAAFAKDKQEQLQISINRRVSAELFWETIDIPFRYHVGIKECLSGLSFQSWGDGSKSNSVIHLIVDEDITIGRLKRKKGNFLCSQQKGGNWSGQNHEQLYHSDNLGTKYPPRVTCKHCLSIIEKFKK